MTDETKAETLKAESRNAEGLKGFCEGRRMRLLCESFLLRSENDLLRRLIATFTQRQAAPATDRKVPKVVRPSPLDYLQQAAAEMNGEWLSDREIITRIDALADRKFAPKYIALLIRRQVGTLFECRRGNSRVHPSLFKAIHNQQHERVMA
jgi:hypothetical protein